MRALSGRKEHRAHTELAQILAHPPAGAVVRSGTYDPLLPTSAVWRGGGTCGQSSPSRSTRVAILDRYDERAAA